MNRPANWLLMTLLLSGLAACSGTDPASSAGEPSSDDADETPSDGDPSDTDSSADSSDPASTDTEPASLPPLRIEAECAFSADAGDCNGAVEGGFNADLPGQDGAATIPLFKDDQNVVGYFFAGSWLAFPGIDLTGYTTVALQVASATGGGAFEIRIDAPDGTLLATIDVPNTGGWETFERVEASLVPVSGVHTVYLRSADNNTYNGDVDWLEFLADTPVPPDSDTGTPDSDTTVPDSDTGTPQTCTLPSSFEWTSTPVLVHPKNVSGHNFVSIKDPSIVRYEGTYHVFATAYDNAYRSVYFNFTDLSQADAAPQSLMQNWSTGNTVAPQVFYFAPQNLWYLIYQWGARYSTNPDINNPAGWSSPRSLLSGEPSGALDFWVICDDANCHLFFSRDDGVLYRSKTTVGNFPSFSGYEIVMQEANAGDLFEASNVYKLAGQDLYLLMVECYGPRYFRSWTAPSLDGPWTKLADTKANPFAGSANVTFPDGRWTNDISHGEMIRSGHDQKMEIDPCHMQFLYQGVDPDAQVSDYNLLPYRLGLITRTN